MLQITPVPLLGDNYAWIIGSASRPRVAVVDPGDAEPVLAHLRARGLDLGWILLTHHHLDHVGGAAQLAAGGGVEVIGPGRDHIATVTRPVDEGAVISLDTLGLELAVWHTPGHTAGHVCYVGDDVAFTGDTLFAAGCGRLFEGTAEEMHASLSRLADLSDDCAVYCAHEYTVANLRFALQVEPQNERLLRRLEHDLGRRRQGEPTVPSTIAIERRTNPFLRCHRPSLKAATEAHVGRPLDTPVAVFAAIRSWKDRA